MQKPHPKVITLTRERIGRLTNIEIQLHTGEMQLHLIVSRTPQTGTSALREEHGRYHSISGLRDYLRKLFGEPVAGVGDGPPGDPA